MDKLIEGFRRFHANISLEQREAFARQSTGQYPEALFITCSDSRVMPHNLTGSGPGDIFVLRNVGNIVPPYSPGRFMNSGETAAIEYAIMVLKVKNIVVCGHTYCGAMETLITSQRSNRLPAVFTWLEQAEVTRLIVNTCYPHLKKAEMIEAAIKQNVLMQWQNLRTHPSVAARLSKTDVRLHAWVYDIETGGLVAFDPSQGQFFPLDKSPTFMKAS